MEQSERYLKHMSSYPVISLSLKSLKQPEFELAYSQLKKTIAEEYRRHDSILQSDNLTEAEKVRYEKLRDVQGDQTDYLDALKFLSDWLSQVYDRKVIILIDDFYGREDFFDTVRKWYDGYYFGGIEVYNPWSVINYVEQI